MNPISKYKSLSVEVKASVSYTVCSILQKCISLITLPIFTRVLSTEDYGQVSVYIAWVAFFSILLSLNLPYGSFQTTMAKFEDKRRQYVSSLEGIFLLTSVIFIVIYLFLSGPIDSILGMPSILVYCMVIEVFANSCLQCWMGRLRFEFSYKSVVAVTLIIALFGPALSLVFVFFSEEKGIAKIVGNLVVTAVIGLAVFILSLRKGNSLFNKEFWKYALGFNIPLLVYYLSQVAFNQSDRIMIEHYCGLDAAGVYSVAYTLGLVMTFIIQSINASYTPWFYMKLKNGKETEDRKIAVQLSILVAGVVLCVIIAAPEIIEVLAGSAYVEAIYVVPPVAMCVLFLFYSCLFDRIMFYYEMKYALTIAAVISGVLNIVLNVILIPVFGYIAAGYTTLASYVILVLCDYYYARSAMKKNGVDLSMFNYKALILVALCFMGIGFLVTALYPFVAVRYVVIFIALIVMIVKRKQILSMIRFKSEGE